MTGFVWSLQQRPNPFSKAQEYFQGLVRGWVHVVRSSKKTRVGTSDTRGMSDDSNHIASMVFRYSPHADAFLRHATFSKTFESDEEMVSVVGGAMIIEASFFPRVLAHTTEGLFSLGDLENFSSLLVLSQFRPTTASKMATWSTVCTARDEWDLPDLSSEVSVFVIGVRCWAELYHWRSPRCFYCCGEADFFIKAQDAQRVGKILVDIYIDKLTKGFTGLWYSNLWGQSIISTHKHGSLVWI